MPGRDLSGRILGEYILREEIGGGGYGVVYRAEQSLMERDVVVKVLHEECRDEISRGRFLREAKLASQLDHPYAAHIYATGAERDDGLLWIAMEFVRGISLGDWLREHRRMPLEQFVPLFEGICEVVQTAHDQGIVHRDIKPSNIMLIERGGRRLPKLLDFGIAKMTVRLAPQTSGPGDAATADHGGDGEPRPDDIDNRDGDGEPSPDEGEPSPDDAEPTRPRARVHARSGRDSTGSWIGGPRLTPSGACLGSHPYMAPEQWSNADEVGPAADLYSLGILAYQALTGDPPFSAETGDEYYRLHRYGLVPSLPYGVPREVEGVLQQALAKFPGGRQKSVTALAADLRRAMQQSRRERLRSAAQEWDEHGRVDGLLWGPEVLEEVTREISLDEIDDLGELPHSFVVSGLQRARFRRWGRRALVGLALAAVGGGWLYRAEKRAQQATLEAQLAQEQTQRAQEQSRADKNVAEATRRQAELDQGRSELIHDEPDAPIHLGRAYQQGDHSPSAVFMLTQSLQPLLAEQARLASTSGRMWSATFSPDSRQIVTTDDQAAQVWDAQTYRRQFVLFHGESVYEARYSADGARIVTAGNDGTVKIWDAASGALVRELRGTTKTRYFAVAVSSDGRLVAAIDTKGDVAHVWNAATGETLAEVHNDASLFPAIAFSADGRWLATTGGDNVQVFDVQARKQMGTLRGPRIRSLAFDPTGPRLLTGAGTGEVAIWAVPSGAQLKHLRDVRDPVDTVAYSPDGRLVAAGSRDGAVQVWLAGSGEQQSQLAPRRSKILAVEFDRTSELLLAAGADGAVVVADADLGMPVTHLEGARGVLVAHFEPSSRRVVGVSLDGTARVWDAASPYRRWALPPVAEDCDLGMNPEPDHRFVAVGCKDHPTRVWDTAHEQPIAELPSISVVPGDFLSASPTVSRTGDRAAVARGDAVEVYELPSGRLLRTIAHPAAVDAVAFDVDGRVVVTGAVDGSLVVSHDDGARLALPACPGGIDAVGVLPDGRVVATSAQRRLRVYNRDGAVLTDLEIPARIRSLQADGDRLVAVPLPPRFVGNATAPLLLDLERYRIVAQLEGHVGRVFSARWVAGGQILTAGADGTARLWDRSTGELRQTYEGSARFLADATLVSNDLVVAGGADGFLRFWDKDSARLLWTFRTRTSPIAGIRVDGSDIVTRGFAGELARWTLPSPEHVIAACGQSERCAILLR